MQPRKTPAVFTYRLDADNRVLLVTPEWESFARENDAPHLTAAAVLGQPLFRFVAGKEAQHLYELTIDKVRRTQRAVTVSFRCDGPCVRRFMELRISPLADSHVELEGRILREEQREPVLLLDSSTSRSDEFLPICSWCKRVEVSREWLEVDDALEQRSLFNLTTLPQLTHTVCADCDERIQRHVDGLDDSQRMQPSPSARL